MNAIATFTASAASAETLAPFAPSLEENTNAVATYNALFVASEASSIAVMATQDRPKRAPTLCVPSMNSVVSPGHSTESSTTPPITSSIPTSSPHRPGKRSFAASEPSAATSVLDPSQALAKRPRGRPKGSKEKTTRLEEMEPAPKKRRGRPPGSKNIKNQAKNACSTTRLTPASSKPTSCIAVQKPTIACVALDASKADTAGQSITLPLPTLAEPSSGSVSSGTTHNDNPFGIDLSRNLKQ
jgi:hypothetical protein